MSCEVWFAAIDEVDARFERLLTGKERGRWERYRRGEDRDRFLVATALLKTAVARWAAVEVESVVVDRSCVRCGAPHGRPRVVGHPVHVSLSHSGGFVGVALSGDASVGIDIEAVTERQTSSLLRYVCTAEERGHIDSNEAFTTCWARKESVLKAVGVGLTVPMTQVAVSAPSQPPSLLAYRGGTLRARMQDVSPGDGYAGCVTVLGSRPVDATVGDGATLLAVL